MRLCWNDWFGGKIADMKLSDAKLLKDIGFEVAGINSGDREATDDDIKRAKGIFAEAGLFPGPFGAGVSIFHPNPAIRRKNKPEMIKALKIAGKLGCTAVRYSVGSMNPDNVWMHHPENHTQKSLDLVIEATKELVPYAEDNRCMLCPETTQWTIVGSIERMREYVDRLDSPYATVVLDSVNQMTSDRVYDNGRWMKCAVAMLGDRIGEFHVKDVMVQDLLLVSHIDEARMGTGVLDHAALMEASELLEPWKTFSLEHIIDRALLKPAYDHIRKVADRIGHTWTDPSLTRERWERERGGRK